MSDSFELEEGCQFSAHRNKKMIEIDLSDWDLYHPFLLTKADLEKMLELLE